MTDHNSSVLLPSSSETRPAALVPHIDGTVDFDRIYQMYGRRVYWWCARMVGDNAEAEDLAQDSFLQLYRSIHSFRGESAFATWLHRVVVTVVLGRLRRKTLPTVPWDGDLDLDTRESRRLEANPALWELTESPLDRVGLQQAVMQLPFTFRAILILHDVQGYRHFEISRILGVPIGTSKSYLHRARLQMRRLLNPTQTPQPSQNTAAEFRGRRLRKRKTMEDAVAPPGSGN